MNENAISKDYEKDRQLKNPTNLNILAFRNAQGVNASPIFAVDHVACTISDVESSILDKNLIIERII